MKTIISIALASALLAGCANIQHDPISRQDDHDTPASHGNRGGTASATTNKSSSIRDRVSTTTRNGLTTTTYTGSFSPRSGKPGQSASVSNGKWNGYND